MGTSTASRRLADPLSTGPCGLRTTAQWCCVSPETPAPWAPLSHSAPLWVTGCRCGRCIDLKSDLNGGRMDVFGCENHGLPPAPQSGLASTPVLQATTLDARRHLTLSLSWYLSGPLFTVECGVVDESGAFV